jgi:hypothetical protein
MCARNMTCIVRVGVRPSLQTILTARTNSIVWASDGLAEDSRPGLASVQPPASKTVPEVASAHRLLASRLNLLNLQTGTTENVQKARLKKARFLSCASSYKGLLLHESHNLYRRQQYFRFPRCANVSKVLRRSCDVLKICTGYRIAGYRWLSKVVQADSGFPSLASIQANQVDCALY